MSTLIVTEKPNVAKRIAESIGDAERKKRNGIYYYEVGDTYVAPAVGHIFTLQEKRKGPWKYPVFDIEWVPSYKANKSSKFTKKYLKNIEFLAKECDSFVNACDYDLEGEIIGYNVIKHTCNLEPVKSKKVKRMKYSTLTQQSIQKSYSSLDEVDKGMVHAGLTRHVMDWYWGINLSRALTLAIRKARGYTTLSIGRVQGPALKILAKRDKKIRNFKPEPYWELEMIVNKKKNKISAYHKEGRFWEEKKAKKALNNCGKTALVSKVQRRKFKKNPPYPFDLTTLQTEAYRVFKISPRDTLQIAQDLYTNAYISYPRTSSQQLPDDINFRGILKKLAQIKKFKEPVDELLSKKKLKPSNGKKKDPAHPAIHPTGEVPKSLSGGRRKIYDLICRRFFATFGDTAVRQRIKLEFDNNKEIFQAKGVITLEPGWQRLYGKYTRFKAKQLPSVEKGEELPVEKLNLHEKETQPPNRYTPTSIIRRMERKNLGTKATRSQIIDILYKRGYVEGKSIKVTDLGLAVVDTLDNHCPRVLSEKLTRKFEEEMQKIREGDLEKDEVIEEGRETIKDICKSFKEEEKEIGQELAKAYKSSRTSDPLGDCFKCDGNLVLRKSKYGGYFIGCDNYPDCRFTISIPKGRIEHTGQCSECGYAILTKMGRRKFRFCINPDCPSKKED